MALVGAGGMAGMHAGCYAGIPNADLVAVMDVRSEAAQELAGKHGAKPYSDFDRMLTETRPDVVDVCCPTPWHVDYVCTAAERAGELGLRGISTEKPMARTQADCERMIAAADQAGVTLFVAHVLRFFPEFLAAKRAVESGEVGQPAAIRTRRGGPMPRGWEDWYAKSEMSGGCILDLIIHDFDWLRWTFGEVERVYACGLNGRQLPAFDYGLVTLRFTSGAICHVEGTWADPGGFKVGIEIAGDAGLLEYNFNQPSGTPFRMALYGGDGPRANVVVPESPTDYNPYQAELQHFIDSLEQGVKPSISPQDGLEAVRIGLAAIESIETGKPVTLQA
ncbi:MAG TPA: Gfo/Idh/MocA family oxidoreductase [Chthonomonadaceae bacterium]|nr:Gfo/Idh/MocA family oxidoreductase [Chthonomonadaceae bacterium]